MNIREKQEQTEMELLSPYATQSIRTKGRKKPEVECEIRTCFQRDRDRIVHCKAFRRLKDKTQVFFISSGRPLSNKVNAHFGSIAECQNDRKSIRSQ